jgi:hypothetical protein
VPDGRHRLFVRRLDADENVADISVDHQSCISSASSAKIDRGLGREHQRIAVFFLPGHEIAQQKLDRLLMLLISSAPIRLMKARVAMRADTLKSSLASPYIRKR